MCDEPLSAFFQRIAPLNEDLIEVLRSSFEIQVIKNKSQIKRLREISLPREMRG